MSESESNGTSKRIPMLIGAVASLMVLFAPTPEGMSIEAQRLAAITILMGIYWVTEALPFAVTSMLPIALYPLLNILPGSKVTRAYSDPTIFLFLGGFLLALGIERWNMHRRIALHVLKVVGSSPRRIVFGFIIATGGLSIWMSNSACALMMVPIGLALIKTLRLSMEQLQLDDIDRRERKLAVPLLLSIAYASSIGGLATYISTPTNMVFRGFWGQQFVPLGYPDVTFAEWMMVFTPCSIIMLVMCGLVMTWNLKKEDGIELLPKGFFEEQLKQLGSVTKAERRVATLFAVTAALWIFREPIKIDSVQVTPGWPILLQQLGATLGLDLSFLRGNVSDASIAVFMATWLFILSGNADASGKRPKLLSWKEAERGIPWGMLLLFGGGFVMADAFTSTGLATWMGGLFKAHAEGSSPTVMVFSVCAVVTALTEFTSNTATANMLMPILAAVALQLSIDPRLLLLPATVSASCGFMMPVGTPPNAIVFATGKVPIRSMLLYGFVLNVIGVVVVATFMLTVATKVLGIPTDGSFQPPAAIIAPEDPESA